MASMRRAANPSSMRVRRDAGACGLFEETPLGKMPRQAGADIGRSRRCRRARPLACRDGADARAVGRPMCLIFHHLRCREQPCGPSAERVSLLRRNKRAESRKTRVGVATSRSAGQSVIVATIDGYGRLGQSAVVALAWESGLPRGEHPSVGSRRACERPLRSALGRRGTSGRGISRTVLQTK